MMHKKKRKKIHFNPKWQTRAEMRRISQGRSFPEKCPFLFNISHVALTWFVCQSRQTSVPAGCWHRGGAFRLMCRPPPSSAPHRALSRFHYISLRANYCCLHKQERAVSRAARRRLVNQRKRPLGLDGTVATFHFCNEMSGTCVDQLKWTSGNTSIWH